MWAAKPIILTILCFSDKTVSLYDFMIGFTRFAEPDWTTYSLYPFTRCDGRIQMDQTLERNSNKACHLFVLCLSKTSVMHELKQHCSDLDQTWMNGVCGTVSLLNTTQSCVHCWVFSRKPQTCEHSMLIAGCTCSEGCWDLIEIQFSCPISWIFHLLNEKLY